MFPADLEEALEALAAVPVEAALAVASAEEEVGGVDGAAVVVLEAAGEAGAALAVRIMADGFSARP